MNENDNNKNRKYEEVDGRVAETYAKDSTATLKSKLGDPYVKAFRWASDRIGKEGIVAFVSNNSFLRKTAFDGMRKHLAEGFDALYILNLGGNVYENPKLSGTAHNVFGIKVGVSINILIKKEFADGPPPKNSNIFYAETDEFWRREKKYTYLDDAQSISGIYWRPIRPDAKYDWFSEANSSEFEGFLSLGNKESKAQKKIEVESIFHTYSLGISTNRDATVYDFDRVNLAARIQAFVATFKSEIIRYREAGRPENLDNFLNYDDIKWSETLKRHMVAGRSFDFSESIITETMYRPFTKEYLYLTDVAVDRPGHNRKFFPGKFNRRDAPNAAIGINGVGSEKIFTPFVVDKAPNLAFLGGGTAWQCFPFYVYDKGKHENITGWALEKFRENYNDTSITKWDIFYYTYAILHHPEYREKYAANLKRELPRIPFAPAFWSFAKAGKELADIHVNYEDQPEYKLDMIESGKLALDWRVERMKYNKEKTAIVYNDFLIIGGIPPEVHNYRLGNRSALDWIVDQYKVSTDTRSGITNDPNRDDDPQYIVRLIKKIITVSLRTNAIVHNLRDLSAEESGR